MIYSGLHLHLVSWSIVDDALSTVVMEGWLVLRDAIEDPKIELSHWKLGSKLVRFKPDVLIRFLLIR